MQMVGTACKFEVFSMTIRAQYGRMMTQNIFSTVINRTLFDAYPNASYHYYVGAKSFQWLMCLF